MSDISNDFESILLKSIIEKHDYFSKCFHLLKEKYFSISANKKIFEMISEYYSDYHSVPSLVDIITMTKDVANKDFRKEIAEALQKINDSKVIDNPEFFNSEVVKFVKNAIFLEGTLLAAEGIQKKSDNLMTKAMSILDEREHVMIDESLGLDFDDVESMISYFSERNIGILTEHAEFNKRLGTGFLPGTLSVICAAQGVGKSLLMCDLISGFIKNGKNVLLVSLEMSEKEMMKRIYANVFDIDVNHFSDLSKTSGELENFSDPVTKAQILSKYDSFKVGDRGKLFIKEYPTGSFSASMLESLVKKYQQQKNVKFDVILVDYLGIAKSDRVSPSAGLYSYVKAIGEEFRAAALNLGVVLISASQLNRSSVNQVENVDNSKISDSMGTAMIADFILFMLQSEEMKENSNMILKVTKNRFNGRTDQWLMDIDYPKMRFNDHVGLNGSTFDSGKQAEDSKKFVDSELQKISNEIKQQSSNSVNDILAGLGIE